MKFMDELKDYFALEDRNYKKQLMKEQYDQLRLEQEMYLTGNRL